MNRNIKTALIIGAVVVLAMAALSFLGGGNGWYGGGWGMMGPGMMGSYGGGWWWMLIPMVLVPALVIWAIVALVRGTGWTGGHSSSESGDSAMEVLRKRYARGDISKQEFEEKRRDLE